MKTFSQYLFSRLGLWVPVVGHVYEADKTYKPNPFEPGKKPEQVKVIDVNGAFVQYLYLDVPTANPVSSEITSFACYYRKAKVNHYEI